MDLRAEKVSRSFHRERGDSNIFFAVQETDFTLAEGKLTILYGPSGSGKSTMLHMLAGLLQPSGGKILLGETDLYALDDGELSALRNEKFGVIPQGQTAIFSLTVLENVLLPYTLYGGGKKDAAALREVTDYALQLLERTDIADLRDVMPSEISGGEMRRMAIARALIRKPAVILADEPTADLDDLKTDTVMQILKEAAGGGAAVLVVTHDKDTFPYADRIFHMHKGVLTEEIEGKKETPEVENAKADMQEDENT